MWGCLGEGNITGSGTPGAANSVSSIMDVLTGSGVSTGSGDGGGGAPPPLALIPALLNPDDAAASAAAAAPPSSAASTAAFWGSNSGNTTGSSGSSGDSGGAAGDAGSEALSGAAQQVLRGVYESGYYVAVYYPSGTDTRDLQYQVQARSGQTH